MCISIVVKLNFLWFRLEIPTSKPSSVTSEEALLKNVSRRKQFFSLKPPSLIVDHKYLHENPISNLQTTFRRKFRFSERVDKRAAAFIISIRTKSFTLPHFKCRREHGESHVFAVLPVRTPERRTWGQNPHNCTQSDEFTLRFHIHERVRRKQSARRPPERDFPVALCNSNDSVW